MQLFFRMSLRTLWSGDFSAEKFRKRIGSLDSIFPSTIDGVKIYKDNIGHIPVDIITPPRDTGRHTLLYIHGGGFVSHAPNIYRRFCSLLALELDCKVFLVDYRLAPECPFPAAVEDCLSAYRWAASEIEYPASQLCVAGDSAGGNLSLVTLLAAKEAGLPMPAAAWLISPAVDCDWQNSEYTELQKTDPMFNERTLSVMDSYFNGEDKSDFRISPVNGCLAGLPPILIEAGGLEMFRNHPVMLEEAAKLQGGSVTAKVWPGMMHVFQLFDFLPEARLSRKNACEFLRNHMGV